MTKKIYFFCSGDSNRAQIAEGFAREYLDEDVTFISTSYPEEKLILPMPISVMREIGIDISHIESPPFTVEKLLQSDYIISICEDPAEEVIKLPPHVEHLHIQVEDPLREGDYFSQLQSYRKVRDTIGSYIKNLRNRSVKRIESTHKSTYLKPHKKRRCQSIASFFYAFFQST